MRQFEPDNLCRFLDRPFPFGVILFMNLFPQSLTLQIRPVGVGQMPHFLTGLAMLKFSHLIATQLLSEV